MGAASSVDSAPSSSVQKLRNYLLMRAFNVRSSGQSLDQQFQQFKFKNNDGVECLSCDSICQYMSIPVHRRGSIIQQFDTKNDEIKYASFIQFLKTKENENNSSTPEVLPNLNRISSSTYTKSPKNNTIVKYKASNNNNGELDSGPPPVPGLWKKREITIQEKITEYTKIDAYGVPQNLVEKEKQQLEIIHMESECGEFAHREITHFEQVEQLNDELVHHETGKEEFFHLKSKHDEISHFESSMPKGPAECEGGPPSPSLKPDHENFSNGFQANNDIPEVDTQ